MKGTFIMKNEMVKELNDESKKMKKVLMMNQKKKVLQKKLLIYVCGIKLKIRII